MLRRGPQQSRADRAYVHDHSGDGLAGLDRVFRQLQDRMVAPEMLAGWVTGTSFRGHSVPLLHDDTMDASRTAAIALATAHVNRGKTHIGTIIVHSTPSSSCLGHAPQVRSALPKSDAPWSRGAARRPHPLKSLPCRVPILITPPINTAYLTRRRLTLACIRPVAYIGAV
jgi:hypothetical protein